MLYNKEEEETEEEDVEVEDEEAARTSKADDEDDEVDDVERLCCCCCCCCCRCCSTPKKARPILFVLRDDSFRPPSLPRINGDDEHCVDKDAVVVVVVVVVIIIIIVMMLFLQDFFFIDTDLTRFDHQPSTYCWTQLEENEREILQLSSVFLKAKNSPKKKKQPAHTTQTTITTSARTNERTKTFKIQRLIK